MDQLEAVIPQGIQISSLLLGDPRKYLHKAAALVSYMYFISPHIRQFPSTYQVNLFGSQEVSHYVAPLDNKEGYVYLLRSMSAVK